MLKGGVIFIKVYSKSLFCFINYVFEICHEKIKRGDKRRTEGSGQKNIFKKKFMVRVALKDSVISIKVYLKGLFCFINYIFEICHEK